MPQIEADWFTASDDRPTFFRALVPDDPRAILLLNHGLHEHSGRYIHVMEHFAERGFAVFAEDHRGHGRTARTLADLESIDAILGDIAVLHRNAMIRCPGLPVFVLGHSMGGLLSTLYAEQAEGLAGLVLNGAALDVPDDLSPVIVKLAKVLSKVTPRLAVEPFYDPDALADDPAIAADVQADPLYYKGKVRARTGDQLLKAIPRARAHLGQLKVPILVTHGTADTVVPPRASEFLFGAAASTDKTLHWFEGMKHEVHNHHAREEVLTLWSDWLEARL